MKWFKYSDSGSWHLVELEPTDDETGSTVCGRTIQRDATLEKDFKASERTCETCLRISASESD